MKISIMSKKSYANVTTATRALKKDPRATGSVHYLPSGRVCYFIEVTA